MNALREYIEAWRDNDVEAIVASVTADVVVTESFGPIYHGQDRVREWAEKWVAEGSRVLDWTVTSELLAGETIVAEWSFTYRQDGRETSFDGATIARARDDRIAWLREYATTAELYAWEGAWR